MVEAEFFAKAIGLDDDTGWGKVRFDTPVFGILMIHVAFSTSFIPMQHCLCLTTFNSTARSHEA